MFPAPTSKSVWGAAKGNTEMATKLMMMVVVAAVTIGAWADTETVGG